MNQKLIRLCVVILFLSFPAYAQRGAPPQTARMAAPIDLTGYWVSYLTEDWRPRMMPLPKGDFGAGPNAARLPFGGNPTVPMNAEGRRIALAWDPDKDQREGNSCKAYGAAGIMRIPGRLRFSWVDDNTLKLETDAGTQTRIFHFDKVIENAVTALGGFDTPTESRNTVPQAQSGPATLQGYSSASWYMEGGRGNWSRGGHLKVTTTRVLPGYIWKNGIP